MITLKSHVEGKWVEGKGTPATLVNPSTEEVLATASTGGIDFQRVFAYARDVGGPALRKMTFRERAEVVRAMSKSIHGHRDELFGLAIANGGNTRSDAKFDVDGAWGTLAAYADLGAELGDKKVLADGEGALLGRSARLFGAHVYVPRAGVAVHINAFNFPAWGLAEKAACAILAGMPVITKPATSTALVAFRIMEILVESGALPKGALSFVAGSTGNLLECLGGQDVLSFTGSSTTSALLRKGAYATDRSAHVNVEADSLNAAVLGPDSEQGSDLWNLFIADVVRDITQKTGQKCTAIRRIYVPKDKAKAVLADLCERLLQVKVGDPSREDVQMGPVATAQQLEDVKNGIARLSECATPVRELPRDVTALGGVGNKGYFVMPALFFCENPSASDVVHQHEVFGPVATVMPYDGSASEACARVALGGGGLVSSIYSDDKAFLEESVLGMAPFQGRISIGSTKIAGQAVPPGTVLPQLLHGGPGRAGGGEELGGRRGLSFYMQRCALQGDRAWVEALSKA